MFSFFFVFSFLSGFQWCSFLSLSRMLNDSNFRDRNYERDSIHKKRPASSFRLHWNPFSFYLTFFFMCRRHLLPLLFWLYRLSTRSGFFFSALLCKLLTILSFIDFSCFILSLSYVEISEGKKGNCCQEERTMWDGMDRKNRCSQAYFFFNLFML